LINDVIPANNTATKKMIEKSIPVGISLKIIGMVININGGPADGSRLYTKTAGMITNAASSAASVSNTAVNFALVGASSSSFK